MELELNDKKEQGLFQLCPMPQRPKTESRIKASIKHKSSRTVS